jgi:hypothetical protein
MSTSGEQEWISAAEAQRILGVDAHAFSCVVASGVLIAKSVPGTRRVFSRTSVYDAIRSSIGVASNDVPQLASA